MNLLSLIRRRDLRMQNEMLHAAIGKIADWQDLALHTTRQARDLAVVFRLSLDTPVDVRDELDGIIREYEDQVARLEEHIVA